MSCGVGCRRGSDRVLLWLWRKPVAIALILPLAWEPPCAMGATLKKKKRYLGVFLQLSRLRIWCYHCSSLGLLLWCRFDPWLRNFHIPQTHKSEWTSLKSQQIRKAGEGVEKREPSYTVAGNVSWYNSWKIVWRFLRKLKVNYHMIQQSHSWAYSWTKP